MFCLKSMFSYMFYTSHGLKEICGHSANGDATHLPHWQMWHCRRSKKLWTCFYYMAQLALNTRGLCSFSSVPVSCTAAHESPLCGDSSLGSVTERWNGSQVTSKNKIMQRVSNLDLLHTRFISCFVLLASPQPALQLTGWIKRVRQHVLVLRRNLN